MICLWTKGRRKPNHIEGDMGGRLFTGITLCMGRLFCASYFGATVGGIERYYM